MTSIPRMTVQLIHIQGPLKGQIHEFNDSEIHIGRHPECQVQFPKELTAISRRHARIVREGNRFKLVDQSTNGCYVNGQRLPEAFLKDGDVITFSENGPKLSFLTVTDVTASQPQTSREPTAAIVPEAPRQPVPPPVAPRVQTVAVSRPQGAAQTVKIPLAIQYGAALKSFHTLPVILGNGPGADFSINHPSVSQRHAQFFFDEGCYWIKDLTGSGKVMLNGLPISGQAALAPECEIALSPQGPKFRFMGGGRLAEIEAQESATSTATAPPQPVEAAPAEIPKTKKPGVFKKFFS
jgi:pSer/pThr/pTyr-binding forkhead associated (FHA) protein